MGGMEPRRERRTIPVREFFCRSFYRSYVRRRGILFSGLICVGVIVFTLSAAAAVSSKQSTGKKSSSSTRPTTASSKASTGAKTKTAASASSRRRRTPTRAGVQRWTEPSEADSTAGDVLDGEDLTVRQAAVEALGPLNGSVVVVDPNTGRILALINQKLALASGFTPCSTIKVPVALAALNEGIISLDSKLRLGRGWFMNLTDALAISNNVFFARLGEALGFQRVRQYAGLFGFGEKAGWNIAGEQLGTFPEAPPKLGGVGRLTSFGEEIGRAHV